MWSHSPHHTYARCGEILDLSTSFIWRYLKILPMWRYIRFLHIYHAKKSEISPPDKFFSTYLAGDTSSTIKKMRKFYATKKFLKIPHKPIFSISFYFHFPLDIQLQPQNNIQQLIINQTPHCTVNMELHLRYIGNISGLPINISF